LELERQRLRGFVLVGTVSRIWRIVREAERLFDGQTVRLKRTNVADFDSASLSTWLIEKAYLNIEVYDLDCHAGSKNLLLNQLVDHFEEPRI
jgi:hypothetical protein